MKIRQYKKMIIKDNKGNTFYNYHEAGRFWGFAPNTVRNDVLGITKYSDTQKGTRYERKIRFMKGE